MNDNYERVEREADAIKCDCGGYAERTEPNEEESKLDFCGRGFDCCGRVFVCSICNKRHIRHAKAPEME